MRTLLRTSSFAILMLVLPPICFPQTDPKNVPQPPTAELRKFDPFLGKFKVSGEFANLPWTGTLELKTTIKGWYIEQVILVKTEGIDREFRILATWDKNVQKYRLWGFQTLPIMPDNGGEIRFEGNEMISEWVSARPDGSQVRSSNRYRFVSNDELEILSYRQVGNGTPEKIGFLKGKRMLNAEEAASMPDQPPANSPQPAPEIHPSPEMQRLLNLFLGTWSITAKHEPSEKMPNLGVGEGEEVYRAGPGGLSLIEQVHLKEATGEISGLGVVWWNEKAQGYRAVWCVSSNPQGCIVMAGLAKWQGNEFVLSDEWESMGKKITFKEILSEITPTSFTQTLYQGEAGGELKRLVTIHATKVAEASMKPMGTSSVEAEVRAGMAERRKASLEGDTDKVESLMADEYLQTDVSGHIQNKSAWLTEYFKPLAALIKAGKFRWEVYEEKDVHIRLFGNAAVATGSLTLKPSGAIPVPGRGWVVSTQDVPARTLRFTRVYIKRNGKWLLAALHNAWLPEEGNK
jgi:hypothetical protein